MSHVLSPAGAAALFGFAVFGAWRAGPSTITASRHGRPGYGGALGRHSGGFAQSVVRGAPAASPSARKALSSPCAETSPAVVRAQDGNGCAERFIRMLKEALL